MTDEYIPRKDLEGLDADAIRRRIARADTEGTISECTTINCGKPARSGVCADCLREELKARTNGI